MEGANDIYRKRTKAFALDIIKLSDLLPKTTASFVMSKQLIRSATSIAANYPSMCLARSSKERFSKMCIVVEETDETLFWLEMITEANLLQEEYINPLLQEAKEVAKIFVTYRSKIKLP